MKILIKYILLFLFFPKCFSIIIFPFKREKKSNNLTEFNLLNNLLENIIITNITLGTPKQIIPLQIKLRRYPLSITCYEKNINNCNNNNSSSYYSLIEEEQYNNEDFTFGIESLETFIN